MANFVVYRRVSTTKQGASGLGLEAQTAAVASFLSGCSEARVVGDFTEIESGRNRDRPQLAAALAAAKAFGATLVVAKLDRLARNAAFLLSLADAGVDFVAADTPAANRLTVGILALVAEAEAEAASSRTKAALAAAKARGVRLGNPALRPGSPATAAVASRAAAALAAQHRMRLKPMVTRLVNDGLSFRAIAARLTSDGVPTARGGQWSAAQVSRIISS